MIIEESDYLEHFGVRGMRWGVRKKRDASGEQSSSKKVKQPLTPEQIQRRVNIGLAVAGGAIFVGKVVLASRANKRIASRGVRDLKGDQARSDMITKLIQGVGKTKVKDVRPPPGAKKKMGGMSDETKKFIADFTAKQNHIIRDANGGLKAADDALQIPFPLREYLDEWT